MPFRVARKESQMLDFGITFKSDMTLPHMVGLAKQAEKAGFTYAWSFDSHILWHEVYPILTLLAANTKRLKLGTLVTNPVVRDPTVTASLLATLNELSGGRMQLGIGRGDSSRRVMGKKPTTVENMVEAIGVIRALSEGKAIDYEGHPIQMTWATGGVPVWVAGYGPKALNAAGAIADGIILQFADPHLIKWCMGFVRDGAENAGRDFSEIQIMSAAPVWVSNKLDVAREKVRWFPALVSNHVVDLVSRYDQSLLPAELTTYIRARSGYDYHHHAEVGSSNAQFVTDEIVDRYCIVGPVKEHMRRLTELQDLGVTQFNIYLMCGDEEQTLEVYGKKIVPHFRGKIGATANKIRGSVRRSSAPAAHSR
jgi:probable F420-dependent oxidoreductase